MGEPVAGESRILTVDQNRLYTGSRYGKSIQAEIEAQTKALTAENRDIEAELEAEEKALTERRAEVTPEEFQVLAEAFDKKVNGIRQARSEKLRQLEAQQAQAQRTFLQRAGPVLAQIMKEKGADVIVDRSAIILLNARVDITNLAIERIDASVLPEAPVDGRDVAPTTPSEVPQATPVAPEPAPASPPPAKD
jgi:Skp family chaperone for outer membrane proteins